MSYATIEIDVRQVNAFWQQSPEIVEDEVSNTLSEASLFIESQLITDLPRGATSHLAQSVASIAPIKQLDGIIAYVGTSLNYAPAVELGTKPHFPPIAPLVDWVRAVMGIEGLEAKDVAFRIARKISRKGTQGKFTFKKVYEQSQSPIEAMFQQMLKRIQQRVSKL